MFSNKCLLITGGTGSFGNAILKYFLNTDIGEIRVFSRDEKKQDDMRKEIKSNNVKYYIGDVREYKSIEPAMKGVDYVFHAAALKQVPSCEIFPMEAFKTNVLGTENVIDCAINNKVKKLICLSTDKAVYPINSMGISKAMMEKIMVSKARYSKTVLCATRYGNLLFSRGSVIPLMVKQILQNKPLTLTDPDMTRYIMTMDEAIRLIFFAFQEANTGDIFVKKSLSVKMLDLVIALKEIFDYDGDVKIIGIRDSEKIYETLLTNQELAVAEDLGNYYRIPIDNKSQENYSTKDILKSMEYNSHNSLNLNINEIKKLLLSEEDIQKAILIKNNRIEV